MVTQADLPPPPAEGFIPFDFDGVHYKLWADGALRQANGHFVLRHPSADSALRARALAAGVSEGDSGEQRNIGHALAGLRQVKAIAHKRQAEQESREGLLRAAKRYGQGSPKVPAAAWGSIVQAQAVIAFAGGRESTGAARFVGEATRFMSGKDASGSPTVQVQVIIGSELARRYGEDVVEGEAHEVGVPGDPVPHSAGETT